MAIVAFKPIWCIVGGEQVCRRRARQHLGSYNDGHGLDLGMKN